MPVSQGVGNVTFLPASRVLEFSRIPTPGSHKPSYCESSATSHSFLFLLSDSEGMAYEIASAFLGTLNVRSGADIVLSSRMNLVCDGCDEGEAVL